VSFRFQIAGFARAQTLARNLNASELCGREGRLFVQSAEWTTHRVEYLTGPKDLPALEVVLGAQVNICVVCSLWGSLVTYVEYCLRVRQC